MARSWSCESPIFSRCAGARPNHGGRWARIHSIDPEGGGSAGLAHDDDEGGGYRWRVLALARGSPLPVTKSL